MSVEDYFCAVSGVVPTADVIVEDEGDDLGDLPLGWLKVTVSRRVLNPKWELIQQVKQAAVHQLLQQVEEEHREDVQDAVAIQVEAQYAAYEEKVGKYIVDEQVSFITDPELSAPVTKAIHPIFELFEFELDAFGIDIDDEKAEKEDDKSSED
jgi:hypothetical protein